eukprot:1508397-Pleurochrysis_carterae.AAC.1
MSAFTVFAAAAACSSRPWWWNARTVVSLHSVRASTPPSPTCATMSSPCHRSSAAAHRSARLSSCRRPGSTASVAGASATRLRSVAKPEGLLCALSSSARSEGVSAGPSLTPPPPPCAARGGATPRFPRCVPRSPCWPPLPRRAATSLAPHSYWVGMPPLVLPSPSPTRLDREPPRRARPPRARSAPPRTQ